MPYHYFDTHHALEVHQTVIEKSGGLPGVKDRGAAESVLAHIRNDDYYPDFLDKITHLVYGINKNHPFHDGNKRASLALSCFFLELNGHDFAILPYTYGMEEIVVWVASSLIDKEQLRQAIEFLLYEDSGRIALFFQETRTLRPAVEQGLLDSALIGRILSALLSEEMAYDAGLKLDLIIALSRDTETL